MSKKPKVFQNKIEKDIRNNKEVFDGTKEDVLEKITTERDNSNSDLTVIDKITQLLNKSGYIFNIPVKITTKDDVFNTHIASVVNNHIITLDNDIIAIEDVINLEY